jgi:hypothetical protein
MNDLEKYMRDHRDEMDDQEPGPGHFERFESRLALQPAGVHPGVNRFAMLRIAALILLLITVSVFIFDFAGREVRERFATKKAGAELPLEIREAVQYYDNQTTNRLGTLHKLAATQNEPGAPGESARKEMQNLDAATAELQQLLAANPGNERILDAIIRNQQMKETVLNNIISQVSQTK